MNTKNIYISIYQANNVYCLLDFFLVKTLLMAESMPPAPAPAPAPARLGFSGNRGFSVLLGVRDAACGERSTSSVPGQSCSKLNARLADVWPPARVACESSRFCNSEIEKIPSLSFGSRAGGVLGFKSKLGDERRRSPVRGEEGTGGTQRLARADEIRGENMGREERREARGDGLD
jgi:hypothetical protein